MRRSSSPDASLSRSSYAIGLTLAACSGATATTPPAPIRSPIPDPAPTPAPEPTPIRRADPGRLCPGADQRMRAGQLVTIAIRMER